MLFDWSIKQVHVNVKQSWGLLLFPGGKPQISIMVNIWFLSHYQRVIIITIFDAFYTELRQYYCSVADQGGCMHPQCTETGHFEVQNGKKNSGEGIPPLHTLPPSRPLSRPHTPTNDLWIRNCYCQLQINKIIDFFCSIIKWCFDLMHAQIHYAKSLILWHGSIALASIAFHVPGLRHTTPTHTTLLKHRRNVVFVNAPPRAPSATATTFATDWNKSTL